MMMMMIIIIIISRYRKYFPPFSEEDEEVFEDNPEEYIRRDIEGSGWQRLKWFWPVCTVHLSPFLGKLLILVRK